MATRPFPSGTLGCSAAVIETVSPSQLNRGDPEDMHLSSRGGVEPASRTETDVSPLAFLR